VPAIGSSLDFTRIRADHRGYLSPTDRYTIGLHLVGGTALDSNLEAHNSFMLGGREKFSGYYRNAVWGRHITVIGLENRYRMPMFERPLRRAVYLRLRANLGNVWTVPLEEVLDEARERSLGLRYGGSLGLGFETWPGAFNADLGAGDHGRFVFHLAVGRHFTYRRSFAPSQIAGAALGIIFL